MTPTKKNLAGSSSTPGNWRPGWGGKKKGGEVTLLLRCARLPGISPKAERLKAAMRNGGKKTIKKKRKGTESE